MDRTDTPNTATQEKSTRPLCRYRDSTEALEIASLIDFVSAIMITGSLGMNIRELINTRLEATSIQIKK